MRMFQSALSLTRICTREDSCSSGTSSLSLSSLPGRLSPSHGAGEGPWGGGRSGSILLSLQKGEMALTKGLLGRGQLTEPMAGPDPARVCVHAPSLPRSQPGMSNDGQKSCLWCRVLDGPCFGNC